MYKVRCPLCGENRTVSPNELFNCSNCETEIHTDNNARISKVQVRPERLLPKLKSLTSEGKKEDAERLLKTLLANTISDSDNHAKVIEVGNMFEKWLSKRR